MNRLKQQNGFTLVESLIVMSIISIMICMPIVPFRKVQQEIETTLFFEELQSSLTLIHHHAVLAKETTVLEPLPDAKKMAFKVVAQRDHQLNHSMDLPDHIELVGSYKLYRFISGSGNLGNLDPIRFKIDGEFVTLKFSLGSGRFELE